MSKLGRTRKELVYYTRLLRKLDYEEVSHFLYISPDYEYDVEDKLILEGNKRGKTMWIGAEKGFALLEPFRERSTCSKTLYRLLYLCNHQNFYEKNIVNGEAQSLSETEA